MKKNLLVLLLVTLLITLVCIVLGSCASTMSEDINASPDSITYHRHTGRRAATGGVHVSKDSVTIGKVI